MTIRVVRDEPEERKKPDKSDSWSDSIPPFSDDEIDVAVQEAKKLKPVPSDPNTVKVRFPVAMNTISMAALDFGAGTITTVKLGDLLASQLYVKLDRLIWHIEHPGQRRDGDFIDRVGGFPFVAAPNIIADGHHALTALWLLAGSGLEVPVWMLPVGIATGHSS